MHRLLFTRQTTLIAYIPTKNLHSFFSYENEIVIKIKYIGSIFILLVMFSMQIYQSTGRMPAESSYSRMRG